MNRLSDYDYDLPDDKIAQSPLENREASKLLWLHRDTGKCEHRQFTDVRSILAPGDLLVLNNTRVTARRVFGSKPSGARVELLLLNYDPLRQDWLAMAKPGRRLRSGSTVNLDGGGSATVSTEEPNGLRRVTITGVEDEQDLGEVPLPPYVQAKLADPERYQTVYASRAGSAAAPTAGLHFTNELIRDLLALGVQVAFVTLDVSIDTFRPIQADELDEHRMHGESCSIDEAAADQINTASGRIIAVGTTAVRTMETFAVGNRRVAHGSKHTDIFIRPGFRFQIVDGLFTNFHMPRTTMLVMLAALVGRETLFQAYREALEQPYRFLSFGDSMLIL